mmetsp:Transcript_68809/g.217595  ORF Transcript_68809/g.217595 Transcript_68809/m.217595 type:complete len:214 (-) Transcript_68809:460-1101(-)
MWGPPPVGAHQVGRQVPQLAGGALHPHLHARVRAEAARRAGRPREGPGLEPHLQGPAGSYGAGAGGRGRGRACLPQAAVAHHVVGRGAHGTHRAPGRAGLRLQGGGHGLVPRGGRPQAGVPHRAPGRVLRQEGGGQGAGARAYHALLLHGSGARHAHHQHGGGAHGGAGARRGGGKAQGGSGGDALQGRAPGDGPLAGAHEYSGRGGPHVPDL